MRCSRGSAGQALLSKWRIEYLGVPAARKANLRYELFRSGVHAFSLFLMLTASPRGFAGNTQSRRHLKRTEPAQRLQLTNHREVSTCALQQCQGDHAVGIGLAQSRHHVLRVPGSHPIAFCRVG